MAGDQIGEIESQFASLMASAVQYRKVGKYSDCARTLIKARALRGKVRTPEAVDLWGSLYLDMDKGKLNTAWTLESKAMGYSWGRIRIVKVFKSSAHDYFCVIVSAKNTVQLLSIPDLDVLVEWDEMASCLHALTVLSSDRIGMLWGEEWDDDKRCYVGTVFAIASLNDNADTHIVNFDPAEEFTSASFDSSGKRLLLGCKDGDIKIIDTSTGESTHRFKAHDLQVSSLALSPSGTYLVTTANDLDEITELIKIWDTRTCEFVGEIETLMAIHCEDLLFTTNSEFLLFTRGNIEIWSASDLKLYHEIKVDDSVPLFNNECKLISLNCGLHHLHSRDTSGSFATGTCFSSDCRYAVSIEVSQSRGTMICYFLDWDLRSRQDF